MTRYLVALLVIISFSGGTYLLGRSDGAKVAFVQLAKAQDESREATAKLETSRLAAQATRDRLTQKLEDAAHADPVSNPAALSVDRVRRLNSIR